MMTLTPQRPPLTRLPVRVWFHSIFTAVLSYSAALVFAGVMLVWVALAGEFPDSDPDTGTGGEAEQSSDDTDWSILAMPIHLVSMAVFGALRIHSGSPSAGSEVTSNSIEIGFKIIAPVLLLTALMVVIIVRRTRRLARRFQVTLPGAIVLASLTAVTFAAMIVGLASAIPISISGSEPSDAITMVTGGIDTFLGAFGLAFFFALVTWIACSGLWGTWVKRYRLLSNGSIRVAAVHLGLLVALCSVLALAAVLIQGDDGRALPLGIAGMVNLGGFLAIGASLGSFTVSTSNIFGYLLEMTPLGNNSKIIGTHSLFADDVPGLLLATLALAVLLSVYAAVLLAARRVNARPAMTSWGTTVFGYGIVGLILQGVLTHSVILTESNPTVPLGDATALPAPWTFLVFMGWGVVVELLARFVFRGLVAKFSPAMVRRLQKVSGIDQHREEVRNNDPGHFEQPLDYGMPQRYGDGPVQYGYGSGQPNPALPDLRSPDR